MMLALNTTMRAGEIHNLQWHDIDWLERDAIDRASVMRAVSGFRRALRKRKLRRGYPQDAQPVRRPDRRRMMSHYSHMRKQTRRTALEQLGKGNLSEGHNGARLHRQWC